jgi:hypothetical protein
MRYISLSNYDTSYNSMMKPGFTYIELAPFSKRRNELIGDHGLMALQSILNKNPESGDVMRNTGGARKVRVPVQGRNVGKSGGARVIYYFIAESGRIYLMAIIDKKEQENLTDTEKKVIKSIIDGLE